ncbi:MAG TPA: hypothetical protein EYP73_08180 [Acidimicrobiia bacterium]|nr:hypothetical protein [Acidimicrobiia bacterium]
MARRSREHRHEIPGYDESRPSREQRKKQHRATRHATHQLLRTLDDPDAVALPEVKRTRVAPTNNGHPEPEKRRFRVWKTRFWKRRGEYKMRKAELDARWPVIVSEQLEDGGPPSS